MYGIEIKAGGEWLPVNPPGGPPPYRFATKSEAETMARVLYPAIYDDVKLLRIVDV